MHKIILILFFLIIYVSGCGFNGTAKITDLSDPVDCAENVLLISTCKILTDSKLVTDQRGIDIQAENSSQWVHANDTTTIDVLIPNGYYSSNICSIKEINLINSNIQTGKSIFSISGSYTDDYQLSLTSTAHKDKGKSSITLKDEISIYGGSSGSRLPSNSQNIYREVPRILTDNGGSSSSSVTFVDRSTWAGQSCGLTGSISERIKDCAKHSIIGSESTWDGTIKGNAGQGIWKLVTRTGDNDLSGRGREVWRDERTGLIWSSRVSSNLNWCKATGSNYITNNPYSENDPNNYCNNVTYQNIGVGPTVKAISACFEDGENFFTNSDPQIDNLAKAGLGWNSSPKVWWRLPNTNDYRQAEIDGIRFVMPDMMGSYEWISTLYAVDRGNAWIYDSFYGSLFIAVGVNRGQGKIVRCVGR